MRNIRYIYTHTMNMSEYRILRLNTVYTQISVLRNSDAKKRDTNGLLPYKFVWEEVPPILYGADTLLYDPLALFEGKGTFVYQVVDSLAILATSVVHHVSISIEPSLYIHNRLSTYKLYGTSC